MSYTVKFINEPSVVIDSFKGERLKKIQLSTRPPKHIEIEGNVYMLSQITSITKTNMTEADWVTQAANSAANHDLKKLEHQGGCKGSASIQWAINEIAVKKHPKNWVKLVQDKGWREQQRQELVDADLKKVWCDYKAGTCACEVAVAA